MAISRTVWYLVTIRGCRVNVKTRLKQLYNESRWSDAVTFCGSLYSRALFTVRKPEWPSALACVDCMCVAAVCKWVPLRSTISKNYLKCGCQATAGFSASHLLILDELGQREVAFLDVPCGSFSSVPNRCFLSIPRLSLSFCWPYPNFFESCCRHQNQNQCIFTKKQ